MQRREFIKLCGAIGLAVGAPSLSWERGVSATEATPYTGTFLVSVDAGGGWDTTMLCDPRGGAMVNGMFPESAIETAGAIRYAPIGYNAAFFQKHASRLTVINGIDTGTNNHDVGKRVSWSGLTRAGAPCISALAAAQHAPDAPMAFVSGGGYDNTDGLVARTRTGGATALVSVAYPNRLDVNNAQRLYHTEPTLTRILDAQSQRLDRLSTSATMPRRAEGMGELQTARLGTKIMARLTQHLPAEIDTSGNRLRAQAQVAMAACKAGIAASANLSLTGFDTHANHDARHVPLLTQLLEGVDFLYDEAVRQGVADRLLVVMASDFGRTPGYNAGGGKDHWPISSMMVLSELLPGGRVIGATDGSLDAMHVDPSTLAAVPSGTAGSVRLTPAHVHEELRRVAGVSASLAAAAPLNVADPVTLL